MKHTIRLLLATALMFGACGPKETTTVTYDSGLLTFTLDTPMTSGPATVQAELELDLDAVFLQAGANRAKIKSVSLDPVLLQTIYWESGSAATFNAVENITIQLFSDVHDLTVLSSLPVVDESAVQEAKISNEVNISAYFSEPYTFLVIDMNVVQPDSVPLVFSTRLRATITAEKK